MVRCALTVIYPIYGVDALEKPLYGEIFGRFTPYEGFSNAPTSFTG